MTPRAQSMLLQARLRRLREIRAATDRDIHATLAELAEMTPRRPHTGILHRVVEECRLAGVALTSRELAMRCSEYAYHRVQVICFQAVREGYLRKVPTTQKVGRCKFAFVYVRPAKGRLAETKS